MHAGIGTEVNQGFGTPDWRIYAGLNWTVGPLWRNSIRSETQEQLKKVPAPTTQKFVLSNLRFKFDSDELEDTSLSDLNQVVEAIVATKHVERVLVEGHTDSWGNDEYNQKLSDKRSLAVKRLISKKVPMDIGKIESVGYGEMQPIADNANYQGRVKNRRVVVIVFSKNDDGTKGLIEIQLTQ